MGTIKIQPLAAILIFEITQSGTTPPAGGLFISRNFKKRKNKAIANGKGVKNCVHFISYANLDAYYYNIGN